MKRLREDPLDDKGYFKPSPLQYGLKATPENKEIVLAMLADGATYAPARRPQATCIRSVVGYIREYSDTQFKFLLETKRPAWTALLTPTWTFDQLLSCKQAALRLLQTGVDVGEEISNRWRFQALDLGALVEPA